jgi:peroxiredoxin
MRPTPRRGTSLRGIAESPHCVNLLGKTYLGMERSTFVIDAEGNVAKVMRKVKPADHAGDVLAALP